MKAFSNRALRIRFALALLLFCGSNAPAQPPPGSVLWSFSSPYLISASPALAPDVTIYLGTAGALYAITNAGSNQWTFAANLQGSPALATNGTIYFGDYGGTFYALNPGGSLKWSFASQSPIATSPAIASDGSIYFVASGHLIALDPTGAQKWQLQVDDDSEPALLSPVIAPDGTIYATSYYEGALYSVTPGGTVKWRVSLGQVAGECVALGADGTVYATGGSLIAFDPDGTQRWSTENTTFIGSSPSVARDGTIYVGQRGVQGLFAFTPDGQPSWNAVPGGGFHSPPPTIPAIDGTGVIYYCASNAVFALTSAGNVQWAFSIPTGLPALPTVCSPAIGTDGTIYVGFANTLYAIQGSGKPLATSPWPMYRQNLRHTGKVEQPTLAPPTMRADNNFDIPLFGEIGQAYTIQSTTNFLNWTIVTNVIANTLPMSISDLTATNAPARFYRATTP